MYPRTRVRTFLPAANKKQTQEDKSKMFKKIQGKFFGGEKVDSSQIINDKKKLKCGLIEANRPTLIDTSNQKQDR